VQSAGLPKTPAMVTFANRPGRDLWDQGWSGPGLALAALGLALGLRLVPEAGDRVWLLPVIALALVPAVWPRRGLVPAAMGLAILASLLILPDLDTRARIVNGLLLAAAALLLGAMAAGTRDRRAARLAARLDQCRRERILDDRVSTLAHDLTQPLTAATAYLQAGQTELARSGAAGDGPGHTLGLARAQLLRAGQVVSGLRAARSRTADEQRPARVSDRVRALTPMLTAMGATAGVVVTARIDARSDRVLVDGVQIQQAMLDLVGNAIDATAGRPGRAVTIRGQSMSTDQYVITVGDADSGVAPGPPGTTDPDSPGFDLSLTRALLDRHGSALSRVPVAPGRTEYRFTLTRVPEAAGRG
jgi:signal transduction histidine kinase